MTSVGVWKVSNPFSSRLNDTGLESASFLKVASTSQDGVAVCESGHSLKLQTEGPHLVSLGGGRLSTAVTIHPLPEGRVYVGCHDGHYPKDIIICGSGIEQDHCFIDNNNGLVTIYPQSGDVRIDGVLITEPTCLSQGCMLCLGHSNFFRFNNPKEALLMKQASPAPRRLQRPSGFVPVESSLNHQLPPSGVQPYAGQYLDGIDLVEKVSKFEYLSHSQPPTITSQDTPKYFVKEGIRILHSAPPLMRIHKEYSSENCIQNPNQVSQVYSPLGSKPGFFTPPPYASSSRVSPLVAMSPKTNRIYSRTPDPVGLSRASPASMWSGRCTPTSPLPNGLRSHHVSAENLKVCEMTLHEQHRKAVQERLRDQEQEKQERLRLEEILHLCAEYEEQTQRENHSKNKKNPPNSNSSSGEFSTESSAPASSNSSKHSKTEEYSSESSKPNGALKYLQPQVVPKTNGASYGYHTVPNRIKTNGSLPRDRGHVSPSSEPPQTFVPHSSVESNGATLFVNQKALNSASSEDELCAIMGNHSIKPSPGNDYNQQMGIPTFTYPNSPRTRIKTVLSHQDPGKGVEVYENRHAVNSLAARKDLTLTLPGTPDRYPNVPVKIKGDDYESPSYVNSNYRPNNHDVEAELDHVYLRKDECLQAITEIKHKVSDLDCQKTEVMNSLQLELALLSGELKDKEQLQYFEGNKLADLQNQKMMMDNKYEITQRELESAKSKVHQQEQLVEDLQRQLCSMQHGTINDAELAVKLDELKAQSELLEIERKAFEDLEFNQLESQAHAEEARDQLGQEIDCFKVTMSEREMELGDLSNQKQSIVMQIDNEKLKCENQLKVYTDELRQEISNLNLINGKLKTLINIKMGGSPCSSPDTSESDIELYRNGAYNPPPGTSIHILQEMPTERRDNRNSFHSFESESSSLTSSEAGGESGRRPEDKVKPERVLDTNKVHQKELAIQAAFQDQAPLVNHHHENGNFQVKLRDKSRSQRPLTRYLPIRNSQFDLRQHVESSGHQVELCVDLHLTPTACRGHLHKLGGPWRTWKKRWFVFDRLQKALLYYGDRGESKLKGGANFQAIEEVYVDHLHSVKSPNPQSTFCVKTFERIYYLMAPTPEAMRIWVDVIFTGAEGYHDFLAEIE